MNYTQWISYALGIITGWFICEIVYNRKQERSDDNERNDTTI